jgi:sugar lactone lactonase YvrE
MNDLVAGPDSIYATDSGLTADFKSSGSAAIYQIKDGKATALIKGDELAGPNGLALAGDVLWVAPFGSNELYSVKDGKRADITKLPSGGLDGLAVLEDGTVLVSSWEGKAIFAGKPGPDAKFEAKFSGLESPADFLWDARRRRVVVPIFMGNALEIIPYE